MMSRNPRPQWKRRRILFPAAALVAFVAALAFAILRSDTSQVIIYNHTGATLGPLTLRACGQEYLLRPIPDETSVHVRLEKEGAVSAVQLSLPATPPWQWEGAYLEPRGGYMVFVHLRPSMEVDSSTQISVWQQMIFGHTLEQ
jgi:hypothetical protein